MKRAVLIRALLAVVLATFVLPIHPVSAQAAPIPVDPHAVYVPGEVVITLPGGLTTSEYQSRAQALAGQMRAQVAARYGSIVVLSVNPNADVPGLVQSMITADPQVRAQPNYVYSFPENVAVSGRVIPANAPYTFTDQNGRKRAFTVEQLRGMRTRVRQSGRTRSIPSFPNEYTSNQFQAWGWGQVEADIVWRSTAASPAVCVIDSGVDSAHPDLSGKVINGPDFVNNDSVPNDDNGHGTHVAGIIAAKMNNGGGTVAGVSNGKIVAVKAMNAQGFGTTATISAALRYCADLASVRVINMSLGSNTQDPIQYNSLSYAIVTRNKLVVAAAGNSGSTDVSYPAAYTNPTVTAPGGSPNAIYPGVISVTAGASNPASIRIWVDLNNDGKYQDENGFWQENEFFDGQDCAVEYSNFGPSVDLVAPGDMIYSDQPVSYPFFNNYYFGYKKKYDYYSGSSMAAPYVAAAAARMLSVVKNLPAYSSDPNAVTMKKRLVSTGRPLTIAVVPNGGAVNTADPNHPFPADPTPNSNYFGKVIYPEPDSQLMPILEMPYCWPSAAAAVPVGSNPYGAAQDMSHARYLDVSAAMGRVGFYAEATNASTGLPLTGAVILATRSNGTTVDAGIVGASSPGVFLLNFPVPDTGTAQYYLWVNKSGFTSGYQFFESPALDSRAVNPSAAIGGLLITPYSTLAVPPNKDISVVLDWDRLTANVNLDLYLWLPENATSAKGSIQGVVNPGLLPDYLPGYPPELDLEQGSLLDASRYDPTPGAVSPYAQVMHDGGDPAKNQDAQQFDTIRILRKPGVTTVLPYYTSSATQPYDVFVTDYSGNYGGLHQNRRSLVPWDPEDDAFNTVNQADVNNFIYPIVRVWKGGKLVNWSALAIQYKYPEGLPPELQNPSCKNATHDWWFALRLQGTNVIPVNECGTAGAGTDADHGILPYPQAATP